MIVFHARDDKGNVQAPVNFDAVERVPATLEQELVMLEELNKAFKVGNYEEQREKLIEKWKNKSPNN